MKIIEQALKELKLSWQIVTVSSVFIDILLVFVISVGLITFIGSDWTYALIPTAIFVSYKFYKVAFINPYKEVEKSAPPLKEKLRTAADNTDTDNFIVQELNKEVVNDIKNVKSSYMVDYRNLYTKLISLAICSFLVLIIANFQLNLGGFNAIGLAIGNLAFDNGPTGKVIDIPNVTLISEEGSLDIYGKASVANLDLKKLEFEINPLDTEINLHDIKDVEKKEFSSQTIPKDIYTTYDIAYSDKIPKENQKIVKKYFDKITR